MTDTYPAVGLEYELRFTRRALDDLGVRDASQPGDVEAVAAASRVADIVEKFSEQRSEVPTGTDAPMRNVGRPDIYSLHGRDGVRACTWFDARNGVCWFLGCVAQHDYATFEARAANGELLPDVDDIQLLLEDRNSFDTAVSAGVDELVAAALESPGTAQRGTVGHLLRLEVSADVVLVDDVSVADINIVVKVPIPIADAERTPDWPGPRLLERIAEMATGTPLDELTVSVPAQVAGDEGVRAVDFQTEIALRVENVELLPE